MFPLLGSAFHRKDSTMSTKELSRKKLCKSKDHWMGIKYFKGLGYPLEDSQDNHKEVEDVWYPQKPC